MTSENSEESVIKQDMRKDESKHLTISLKDFQEISSANADVIQNINTQLSTSSDSIPSPDLLASLERNLSNYSTTTVPEKKESDIESKISFNQKSAIGCRKRKLYQPRHRNELEESIFLHKNDNNDDTEENLTYQEIKQRKDLRTSSARFFEEFGKMTEVLKKEVTESCRKVIDSIILRFMNEYYDNYKISEGNRNMAENLRDGITAGPFESDFPTNVLVDNKTNLGVSNGDISPYSHNFDLETFNFQRHNANEVLKPAIHHRKNGNNDIDDNDREKKKDFHQETSKEEASEEKLNSTSPGNMSGDDDQDDTMALNEKHLEYLSVPKYFETISLPTFVVKPNENKSRPVHPRVLEIKETNATENVATPRPSTPLLSPNHFQWYNGSLDELEDNGATDLSVINTKSTKTHLRKAKLMFFWVRYPSSAMLKMYFPDIKFNKNNTAQLVKWFSNFREFYYKTIETSVRKIVQSTNCEELCTSMVEDSELYRIFNVHYNYSNVIEVPPNFRYVVEQTLREFFRAIQGGKDTEQSWKKSIYKVISRLDDPVPEYFKLPEFLHKLK